MTAALNEVDLPQAKLAFRDEGEGKPIVFIHGLLVDGRLWRDVTPELRPGFRCIVPDLPLGSHSHPTRPGTDLSPPGLARLVADFLAALDLDDVTLVGNDTGGAICQLVAVDHPERLGRLVLTPCDAYENFLPPAFRPLQYAARVPGLLTALVQPVRFGPVQRSPLGFGWLIKRRPLDAELLSDWLRPVLRDSAVRADAIEVLRRIDKRYTLEAAERLRRFDRPALIAWAIEDRFFKLRFGERLAEAIPDARLERVPDSWTFMPIDQPQRLGRLIADFAGAA